jgi:hypothetical protein
LLTAAALLTMLLAGLAGVLLTILTLPGVWITLAVAIACQFIFPEPPFSWYTLGICTALALAGEVYELFAAPAAARRKGAGHSGALGSLVGSIAGAIIGAMVIPIVGAIPGAVLGAGLGALSLERGIAGKSWSASASIATAAATGRLIATLLKVALAAGIAIALAIATLVR